MTTSIKAKKYGNKKVEADGFVFDSTKEFNRYYELKLLQRAGRIRKLEVHPKFELQPKFIDKSGVAHRAITYSGDFAYIENDLHVVEDVKSEMTRKLAQYRDKKKMFLYKFPDIIFKEVL
ncbi:MAG: DUF1064 domain-containing protein [Epsilonproteobacteria bacterium]|nr:DUF1064 domain-containing protein [Campylobacterota bacterium]